MNRCCNRCYPVNKCCYDDRLDSFLLPMMFWLFRDVKRCCHCNCKWVDRYDKYKC